MSPLTSPPMRPARDGARPVYACHLIVEGDPDDTLPLARASGRWALAQSLGGWPEGAGGPHGQIQQDGIRVGWRTVIHGPDRVWEAVMVRPFDGERSLRWQTLIQVGVDAGQVFVYAQEAVLSTESALSRQVAYEIDPPPVVPKTVEMVNCVDGGHSLTGDASLIGRKHAATLARLLAHPGRRLPVVAFHEDHDLAREAAHLLVGLAHVVVVTDGAREDLTEIIGDEHEVPRNGARLWWPHWTPAAPAAVHPRFHQWDLVPGAKGRTWPIARVVFTTSAFRLAPPPTLARLDVLAARERMRRIESQARAGEGLDEVLQAWEADLEALEEARSMIDTLNEDLDQVRADLNGLLAEFDTAVDQAAQRRADHLVALPSAGAPTSVIDAVRRAEAECERLVFLPEAIESAERSPFVRPVEVYEDLVALDRIAKRWADDDLPGGFTPACREVGLPWKSGISDTAANQFAVDYERTYEGDKVLLGPHLSYGANVPQDRLLRIYCYLDRERRKVVVGWVGPHLRDHHNR